MIRAGVFIGVDRTGTLQELHDAAAGAKRMHEWALRQGMDPNMAKLLTDAGGARVGPDQIFDTIRRLVEGPGVDQLIVYFAGHGVNINRNEFWLLSDAPVNPNAAVNVSGSVDLARYSGLGEVVFISDACRVAPAGIQAQSIHGSDIFPNGGADQASKPVHQFFACGLGNTAAEIKDPAVAAGAFSALYTNALLDGLDGRQAELLEASGNPADPASYVRHGPLADFLAAEIPRRVLKLKLQNVVNQNPDAILIAQKSWLSRLQAAATATPAHRSFAAERPVTVPEAAKRFVRAFSGNNQEDLVRAIDATKAGAPDTVKSMAESIRRLQVEFGPDHFQSQCGIKVRGADIKEVFCPGVAHQLFNKNLVKIESLTEPAASIVLEFDGRFGTVIPAIRGFLAALTFEGDELVNVAYEPSTNTERWKDFEKQAPEVRALRAIAASASQHGRFRLDPADALPIARRMQYLKTIDPTLGIYAAYAYRDLQDLERLNEMSQYLLWELQLRLFDVELVRRGLLGKKVDRSSPVFPFVPMLAQGWALVGANRVSLPRELDSIQSTVRESLWSLYDARGVDMLKAALTAKVVL
jgi:hypothetical protein